jgi:hypothetical protein
LLFCDTYFLISYKKNLNLLRAEKAIMKKFPIFAIALLIVLQGCCSNRSVSANRNSSAVGCGINFWSEAAYTAGDGSEVLLSK